jgi:hypothetical protein
MGQDAECYQKTVDDRTIILNPRAYYYQPFIAEDWTDLRFGFFLSLTDEVNDDVTTGLSETIVNPIGFQSYDRYWLGVSSAIHGWPFLGFTNMDRRFPDAFGDTVLASSDAGVGAGTTFWRPRNSIDNTHNAAIVDTPGIRLAAAGANCQQHFPQDAPTVAAGYAVLLGLQLLRDDKNSTRISMRIKSSANSADMLYSNTPTKELIRQSMENWPDSVQAGPVTLSNVPNSFFFSWPFRNSRLRIHSLGLLRAA